MSVWLITGAASGIGRALAAETLAAGHRVVVSARRSERLADLASAYPETSLALSLDVTSRASIDAAVRDARARFGGIDVLVNNAAVGCIAGIEEARDDEIRALFETNVLGLDAVTRAVLPGMRAARSGTIVNVSSVAGIAPAPALGHYAATKFAVEGLSEVLWREVEPLGLRVLVVELGHFRTAMETRSFRGTEIAAYAETVGAMRRLIDAGVGHAAGDPERAASAIRRAVDDGFAGHRLVLGSDSHAAITAQVEALRAEIARSAAIARTTDFPAGNAGESILPWS